MREIAIETKCCQAASSQQKSDMPWMPDDIVTRIVENLQVFVNDIHIRYEDTVSSPNPFAIGLTLESLHFQSADANWTPVEFESGREIINKV
jgi:hypothetical protein